MISVTERAAAEFEELLRANDAAPGEGVKLVANDAGTIDLTIEAPDEGDEVIRQGEEPLLIVEGAIAGALDGALIDCETERVDGGPRTRFKLLRPAGD